MRIPGLAIFRLLTGGQVIKLSVDSPALDQWHLRLPLMTHLQKDRKVSKMITAKSVVGGTQMYGIYDHTSGKCVDVMLKCLGRH